MYELLICTQGKGRFVINDQHHILRTGDFVLCEPNDVHEVINDGQTNLVMTVLGIKDKE